MDVFKGLMLIVFVIGLVMFFRWLMKPDLKMKARAEEFNQNWEGSRKNDYPTDEEQQPIYGAERGVSDFREGYPQHRPRTTTTKRPVPPPPPMRDGRGRPVPLRSSSAIRDHERRVSGVDDTYHTAGLSASALASLTEECASNRSRSSGDGYNHNHVNREPTHSSRSDDDYSGGGGGGGGSDD